MTQKVKVGDRVSDSLHKKGGTYQKVSAVTTGTLKGKAASTITIPTHTPVVDEDSIILSEARHNGMNDFVISQ